SPSSRRRRSGSRPRKMSSATWSERGGRRDVSTVEQPPGLERAPGVAERGALLRRRRLLAQKYLSLVYPVVTIAGLVIYFSIESSHFFTTSNAANISRQAAVLLMFALAGTVVILIGGIDLSVGANAT